MKKFILIGFVCLLGTNLFAQTNVLDKVIAIVGKNMIKQSELETTYLQQKQNYGVIEEPFNVKCEIFESLLINKLMLHQSEIDSVNIPDVQINREMDTRVNYMINSAGSKENLERQMNKSISEIKEFYKDVIKENLLITEINGKITSDVKITPKEVTDFYNSIPKDSLPTIEQEFEFSQIVITPKISQEEKEIIKDKLNGYRERILKGDKFSTLATLYSEDEMSAKKGGELGFFSRGAMVSEFESVAFPLREGEVSPVFESKFGFHIIQMIERRGDQINCRHILIMPKVSSLELNRTKKALDSIQTLINNKEISFEDAIKKFSDDPSKLTGGKIINPYTANARFPKDNTNEMMGNIEKINFEKYNQGDIIKPTTFKTESGSAYRLIKINTKTEKHKINLKDDYDKVYNSTLDAAKTKAVIEWAENRISKTYIKIDNDYKDCDYKMNWMKNN
ncbi:MAG: peptidylprolyl isomerase [Bacteroidales bacterium]